MSESADVAIRDFLNTFRIASIPTELAHITHGAIDASLCVHCMCVSRVGVVNGVNAVSQDVLRRSVV